MALTEPAGFGGLSLVKKDGSHSQRFPLVERRYLFGRCGSSQYILSASSIRGAPDAGGVLPRGGPLGLGRVMQVTYTVVCNRALLGDGLVLN